MAETKLSSIPTIKRLPSYLHVIEAAHKQGAEFISGTTIAEELELEPIQVRKDLALTGIVGKPRVGFPVGELLEAINGFLSWNSTHQAVLIGAGHLGTALIGYGEFAKRGMKIVAAFDTDPEKHGTLLGRVPVLPLNRAEEKIKELGVNLAILTVPSAAAQEMTDKLVGWGIRAIWNFTNVKIKVREGVVVQREDLSSGFAVLSVKMAHAELTP